jgi:hypothetical protein
MKRIRSTITSPFFNVYLCTVNVIMLNIRILFTCNENNISLFSIRVFLITSCNCVNMSANVAQLLFHYFWKTSLTILYNCIKLKVLQCGSVATAILSQPSPTGNTLLSPEFTIKWKISSYWIVSDYCFIRQSKSVYVPFSYWYDWAIQEEVNPNVYTLVWWPAM